MVYDNVKPGDWATLVAKLGALTQEIHALKSELADLRNRVATLERT